MKMAACIFCRIIKGNNKNDLKVRFSKGALGEIPSIKLLENDKTLAFLDISPLSRGHAVGLPLQKYGSSTKAE